MMIVPISQEAENAIGFSAKRDIVAPLEVCPPTHKICRDYNVATSLQFRKIGKIPQGNLFDSPCDKNGYNKYKISCPDCKEKLIEVYSKNATLSNWRGLRYFSWHDKKEWHGTFGVNVKDDIIRIDCTCSPNDRKLASKLKVKEIQ